MPNELFVKVSNEDGSESYAPLSEVEELPEDLVVPEPVVQKTEAFNSLLKSRNDAIKESKKRLRRAQAAENALSQYTKKSSGSDDADDDSDDDADDDEGSNPPIPQPQMDEESMYLRFRQRLAKEATEVANQQQAQDVLIEKLITDHKLQGIQGIKGILSASSDPANTAATLGRNTLVFDNMQGGETPMQDMDEAAIGKVYEMLGLPAPKK